ncbi:NAD-dependent epimerase/dehydratase family protein [Maribacter algicola]|uniref:NAD-dependent epimerase/dehydratase family protein n=1 Tax=Maribacter algicola TaxID=2498892 RepID=A0A3R8R9W7_9FLAO|nr:NAD(P)H-binding protein [Maribacter algicola]RRQ50176.1 NAD-dependent epimerase/dehydratase family protein [Maribacter algicola]
MERHKKSAIILGATGLTGSTLLQLLLEDSRYETIKLFSRKPVNISSDKIEEHLGDVLDLGHFKPVFKADEVFCCIGTTKSKTPDRELYRKIDFGIPVEAARMCKANGIDTFMVISAMGADPNSTIFYNRVKGEMEDAVLKMGISKTYILQPSLISGPREERRPGEWLAKQLFKVLNVFMVGPLKKYRSIHPKEIAICMLKLANGEEASGRITSDEIKIIASHD